MHDRLMSIEERYSDPQVLDLGSRDERWLTRARRVAQSVDGRWRVGCVIVRGNRVLAAAANSERNQAGVLDGCFWLMGVHAEIAALRQVASPRGASVFVARIGRDGRDRHAQPCVRCQEALTASAVGTICWTSDSQYVAARRLNTPQASLP